MGTPATGAPCILPIYYTTVFKAVLVPRILLLGGIAV